MQISRILYIGSITGKRALHDLPPSEQDLAPELDPKPEHVPLSHVLHDFIDLLLFLFLVSNFVTLSSIKSFFVSILTELFKVEQKRSNVKITNNKNNFIQFSNKILFLCFLLFYRLFNL